MSSQTELEQRLAIVEVALSQLQQQTSTPTPLVVQRSPEKVAEYRGE